MWRDPQRHLARSWASCSTLIGGCPVSVNETSVALKAHHGINLHLGLTHILSLASFSLCRSSFAHTVYSVVRHDGSYLPPYVSCQAVCQVCVCMRVILMCVQVLKKSFTWNLDIPTVAFLGILLMSDLWMIHSFENDTYGPILWFFYGAFLWWLKTPVPIHCNWMKITTVTFWKSIPKRIDSKALRIESRHQLSIKGNWLLKSLFQFNRTNHANNN